MARVFSESGSDGLLFLMHLREDVLGRLSEELRGTTSHRHLRALDATMADTLAQWFVPGVLELHRITFASPGLFLERVRPQLQSSTPFSWLDPLTHPPPMSPRSATPSAYIASRDWWTSSAESVRGVPSLSRKHARALTHTCTPHSCRQRQALLCVHAPVAAPATARRPPRRPHARAGRRPPLH